MQTFDANGGLIGDAPVPLEPDTSEEPRARGTILRGFRAAALQLWGPSGLEHIASLLPADARRETIDGTVFDSTFVPERHVLAWFDATFKGPCASDLGLFREFIDRMMDHGFGRVRRLFLSVASAEMLWAKCEELWRYDHTHGSLTLRVVPGRGGDALLRDHAYLSTELGRTAITEVYRYATSLTRDKIVSATYVLEDPKTLRVRLSLGR